MIKSKNIIKTKTQTPSQIKGTKYEKYVKSELLAKHNRVYLWSDIPMETLKESNIHKCYSEKRLARKEIKKKQKSIETEKINPITDTGCDILYYNDKEWIIVQCKDHESAITIEKLAGFFKMTTLTNLKGELYHTSTISSNLNTEIFETVKFTKLCYPKEIPINTNKKLVLYDYQNQAYEHLKDKKRSILQLPCGMGKTLVAIKWASNFDHIIIFSPLKGFAEQNLEKFSSQLPEYKCLLIDSDGTRNANDIKEAFKTKCIFSVTYKSVDVIAQILDSIKKYNKVCFVIDEFHNLTADNVLNKNNNFYKVLSQDKFNYLFLSATPRVYELEDLDADIINITGKIEYKYDFRDAIKNGFICDYNVYIPDITINKEKYLKEIEKEVKLEECDDKDSFIKASYLTRCLDENGYSKCISYCKDINDAKIFKNALTKMNEYHCINLKIEIITAETNNKDRNKILKEFADYKGRYVICSVHILDECVDIVECDSIFLNNKCSSKTRLTQRICRPNRKDKNRPDKVAGVFLWCTEYDELCETISSIKEFDIGFEKEKVKMINYQSETEMCIIDRTNEKIKYVNMDKFIVNVKKVLSWDEKKDLLFEYCDLKKCCAISTTKYKNVQIGTWLQTQKSKINSNTDELYKKLSINAHVKKRLDVFLEFDNKPDAIITELPKKTLEENKNPNKYGCNVCSYYTHKKDNLDKHIKSEKHLQRSLKNSNRLCKYCNTELHMDISSFNEHINICADIKINMIEKKDKEQEIKYKKLEEKQEKLEEEQKEKYKKLEEKLEKTEDKLEKIEQKYNILSDEHKTLLTDCLKEKNIISNFNDNRNVTPISTFNYISKNFSEAPVFTKIVGNSLYDKKKSDYKHIDNLVCNYDNKRLIDFIGNHIIRVYKKDNIQYQSVFNSDTARLNYIIRTCVNKNYSWNVDKEGKQFIQNAILPLLENIKIDINEYIIYIENQCDGDLDHHLIKNSKMKTLNKILAEIENNMYSDILKKVTPHFYFDKNSLINKKLLTLGDPNQNIKILENKNNTGTPINIALDNDVIFEEIDDEKVVDKELSLNINKSKQNKINTNGKTHINKNILSQDKLLKETAKKISSKDELLKEKSKKISSKK